MGDKLTKALLSAIAILLAAILAELHAMKSPTFGDLRAIIESDAAPDLKMKSRKELLLSVPLVRIQGGSIDANVQGSVSID